MGESKVIKKFHRLLEECEEGHIFNGTILEFDTVEYVPKERLAKGMIVTSKGGTRRVNFSTRLKSKSIVDVSSLHANDLVHVFGKKDESRTNCTIPSIIMIPERRVVLFARTRDMFSLKGDWADYVQALSYLLAVILGGISQLSLFLPLGLFQSTTISLQIGLIAFIFFIIMIGVDWYRSYVGRSRVVQCDSDTWKIISDEVTKRFSISFS
ncbi:MAG: hypothetical protein ACTSU3_01925 [Candidatus Thorarchaeota archaeon]